MATRGVGQTETRRLTIAEVLGGKETIPLEEVVLTQAFQLEALTTVSERQGVIKKADVLEEIRRLQANTPTGR